MVFFRYQLLAVVVRDAADPRTIGSLFWAMCDEVADLRFVEAWYLLTGALRAALSADLNLTDAQVDHLLTVFLGRLPGTLRQKMAIPA